METRTLSTTASESPDVPIDRLFRISPEVYQGMIAHGLLPERGQVAFVDGLLVDEPTERVHPISLEVYRAMVAYGLLSKYDKIELLDGLMVEKMTKGGPHVMSTYYVGEAFEPSISLASISRRKRRLPCQRVRRAARACQSRTFRWFGAHARLSGR